MSDRPVQFSIEDLFKGGDCYIIPMYQRNYAWEEGEITLLIQDIIDSLPAVGQKPKDYYIGSLVVFQRQDLRPGEQLFETIDGQQRLTTLLLLMSYLRYHRVDITGSLEGRLHFESREKSSYTLDRILAGNYKNDPEEVMDSKSNNPALLNGYRLIQKILPLKLKEFGKDLPQFADYLFKRVQIIRVTVPEYTDLNHYFEIMNSRGEQLEKHEILKAQLLSGLEKLQDETDKETSKQCLHTVWEACSNMEKYVQMGFSAEQRSTIFGSEWKSFVPKCGGDLTKNFNKKESSESPEANRTNSIENIVKSAKQYIGDNVGGQDDAPDRFHSPVNFVNFILHVLRVWTQKDVPLDDKRLLSTFKEYLIDHGPEKIQEFTFALLKCKWLFDHYIIKRYFNNNSDTWSLKHLQKSKENNSAYYRNIFEDDVVNHRILMLLASFHVSAPTMVYKHWLSAALHYLFQLTDTVEPKAYLEYLESVARAFVFDRHLATSCKMEYFEIIFRNHGQCHAREKPIAADSLKPLLRFWQIENNLIFNHLDYLLWLKHKDKGSSKIKDFKFTFRSSVEHYYPQNPEHIPRLDEADLNAFGNLCLISHSKNSRLSNFPPEAKKSDYQHEKTPIDSIKQHLMMEDTPPWTAEKIRAHTTAMIDILIANCNGRDPSILD